MPPCNPHGSLMIPTHGGSYCLSELVFIKLCFQSNTGLTSWVKVHLALQLHMGTCIVITDLQG